MHHRLRNIAITEEYPEISSRGTCLYALHIHSYPAEGKGKAVERDVLDLLDL